MAKRSAGLPEDYDLRVSGNQLVDAPASLAGYLDDEPSLPPVAPVVKREEPKPVRQVTPTRVVSRTVGYSNEQEQAPLYQAIERGVVEKPKAIKKPTQIREKVRRIQINVTPEVEQRTQELLEILSRQSPDGRVTVSELMQALVHNLYDARDYIDGRLPQRGRWGTASAKSYAAELSIVLREAIQKDGKGKGQGAFRKAIGQ
jgi:hypothetical protein